MEEVKKIVVEGVMKCHKCGKCETVFVRLEKTNIVAFCVNCTDFFNQPYVLMEELEELLIKPTALVELKELIEVRKNTT